MWPPRILFGVLAFLQLISIVLQLVALLGDDTVCADPTLCTCCLCALSLLCNPCHAAEKPPRCESNLRSVCRLPLGLVLLVLLLQLVFFLPQLVQLLRADTDGTITNFFLTAASHSDLFCHQLIWALNSEAKPPEEALNPEVKR